MNTPPSSASGTDIDVISLEPNDRAWLHARIEQRFAAMLTAGFLEKIQTLPRGGDLTPDLPSMRFVGYRQAWEQMDAMQLLGTHSQEMLATLHETAVAATRQLAKRQMTWLRSMPERHTIAWYSTDPTAQALTLVQGFTAKGL